VHRSKRSLLWYVLGTCCYLAGLLLFLVAFLGVYLAAPERSFSNFTQADAVAMAASAALLVLGRTITWKFGDLDYLRSRLAGTVFDRGPDENHLQALGYNVPPEETSGDESAYGYEGGAVYLQCPECGKRNDPAYTFCGNCSAELPDA